VLPWILYGIVFVEASLLVKDPATVHRKSSNTYCNTSTLVQAKISCILYAIGSGIALIVIARASVFLYRNWMIFRQFGRTNKTFELNLFVRIGLFALTTALGVSFSPLYVATGTNPPRSVVVFLDLLLNLVPISVGIFFGTQKDIMQAWLRWAKAIFKIPCNPSTCDQKATVIEDPEPV